MKGCECRVQLGTIESKVDAKLEDVNKRIKHMSSTDNIKDIKTWLRKVWKEITKKVASADHTEDSRCVEWLCAKASSLQLKEDTIRDKLQE